MAFGGFKDFFRDYARGLPPKSGPKKKPAAKKPAAKKPQMSYGQSTVKVPPKPKPLPPKGRGKVVRSSGKAAKATAPAKTNAKAPAEKGMKHKECTCKH